MTEVQGLAPLRHRLYSLCLTGEGDIDWTAVAALKTHVSLREALELEAVRCEAGDRRHAFQVFYPKYMEEQRRKGADTSKLGELDPARVLEEIEMTRQAITQHETLLADHRAAIVDGKPSPLSDKDVDGLHATLQALRSNLPFMESEYSRLLNEHRERGGDGKRLPELAAVGPVQSGTLRPFKEGR